MRHHLNFWLSFLICVFLTHNLPAQIKPNAVIISEFLADPSPTIGLPNAEYVEIYNRSADTILLSQLRFINGSIKIDLPAFRLKPKGYAVIYAQKSGIDFKIKDTVVVARTLSLTNTKDAFQLVNLSGTLIDVVRFDAAQFGNTKKAQGGWSLERVNLNDPCRVENWRASNDPSGGTPGRKNSVFDTAQIVPLRLLKNYTSEKKLVKLSFNKRLSPLVHQRPPQYFAPNQANFSLENWTFDSLFFDNIAFTIAPKSNADSAFFFKISENLADCDGTKWQKDSTLAARVPQKISPNDLIINEILFNPIAGGARYVEFFNKSKKTIDLSTLTLKNADGEAEKILVEATIEPNSFAVVTENPNVVAATFLPDSLQRLRDFFYQNNLPPIEDDEGTLTLVATNAPNTVIDSVAYGNDFHNALLKNTEGVALERVDTSAFATNKSSWQSAARPFFGSPAQKNTARVSSNPSSEETDFLLFENTVFSPTNLVSDVSLRLRVATSSNDALTTVHVFDAAGHLIKKLINNELLPPESSLRWDGDTDDGTPAPAGIYIVLGTLVSASGTIRTVKKAVVLM